MLFFVALAHYTTESMVISRRPCVIIVVNMPDVCHIVVSGPHPTVETIDQTSTNTSKHSTPSFYACALHREVEKVSKWCPNDGCPSFGPRSTRTIASPALSSVSFNGSRSWSKVPLRGRPEFARGREQDGENGGEYHFGTLPGERSILAPKNVLRIFEG
jgi:hypothetical protein